jgi:uncharacterized protein (TIGR00730 family)
MRNLKNICVFCGASPGAHPVYMNAAQALGAALAARGIGLVYGGGTVGLMGAIARSVASHGGRVIGVIPGALMVKELVSDVIGELNIVETMHERKARMVSLADAFIGLPGGFGTLDELFEAITWGQLGIHSKPIGLLNVNRFFDPLLSWVDLALAEGFVRPQHRRLVQATDTPAALLDLLAQYIAPPGLVKWEKLSA